MSQGADTEDGDFVALRASRVGRKEEEPFEEILALPATQPDPEPTAVVHRPSTARSRDSAHRLFAEAKTAKLEDFLQLLHTVQNRTPLTEVQNPSNNNKQNILHHVLEIGRQDLALAVIQNCDVSLLCQQCDVTVAGIRGKKNVLHYVTELRSLDLAKAVLNKVPKPENKKDNLLFQETPVEVEGQRPRTLPCCHLAAFLGATDMVIFYLDSGVHVNNKNSKKDTALLWAARWNHLETVRVLLERKADTSVENDKGSTALYWAVRYGHVDTVRLLIKEGRANVQQTRKLGLVAPIVVACALGYLEIVKLLIENGADPNFCIRGREFPLHHAAKEGYSEIVSYLLDKNARIDEADEGGDTALLLAARNGHARCLQILLSKGANHAHKNHTGEDLMSIAVQSDIRILKVVLYHLRLLTADSAVLSSPLLLAASAGSCEKIRQLLEMGLDPSVTDENKNTMLHRAALENRHEVITEFHSKVKIDSQNVEGNTALHLACKYGHAQSIGILVRNKATASICNNRGETPLHMAATCRTINPDTVNQLIEYVIKTHAWESLNMKDIEGNNALHLAATFARPDVLWEFRNVPIKTKNDAGNIALHNAVRKGEPEVLTKMLDIYEEMKRDANINEQNKGLQTVLHLAAKEGFKEHIARLVLFGADLSLQDRDGNTVLHVLTQLSADKPHLAKTYLLVFEEILQQAAMWWCMQHKLQFSHGDKQAYDRDTRTAALKLLTDTYNNSDLNVLGLACKAGAASIVQLIMARRGVMCFHYPEKVVYNVTNMTPLTNNSVSGCCTRGAVVPRPSYIEWLLSLEKAEMASSVLDVQPFRDIEDAYGSIAAWTYAIIMLVHIIYMALISYSGIALLEKRRKDPSDKSSDAAYVILYAVAPLEPCIIFLIYLYTFIKFAYTGDLTLRFKMLTRLRKEASSVLYNALPVFIGILYSVLVLTWIVLYSVGNSYMDYVFSVAICMGWLYTISFTRGFRPIHYFWRMIQNMIIKDIMKFLFIYLFVLLAFAFAIHAVIQVSQAVADEYPSPLDTMFLVFNLMIGRGDLFDNTLSQGFNSVHRNTTYLKVLYLIYIILATILLLNLLIAMMNDSYSAILQRQSVTWRLEAVQLGVDIEKSVPLSSKLFGRLNFQKDLVLDEKVLKPSTSTASSLYASPGKVVEEDRVTSLKNKSWYISIPPSRVREMSSVEDEIERETLRELRSKVVSIEHRLATDLQQLKNKMDEMRSFLKTDEKSLKS